MIVVSGHLGILIKLYIEYSLELHSKQLTYNFSMIIRLIINFTNQ